MKISKLLLMGALIAGMAGAASAQTTEVYLCGSTAYRAGVTKAIEDVLWNNSTPNAFNANWDDGTGSSSIYSGGAAIFTGTYDGTPIIVHTYWTGSLAGDVDVSSSNSLPFMSNSTPVYAAETPTTVAGVSESTYPISGTPGILHTTVTASYTTTAVANVAMSDAFASSVAKSLLTVNGGSALATKVNTLSEAGTLSEGSTGVGLLPFEWVAGAQSNGQAVPFTNITQEAAAALIANGRLPAMCFLTGTGATADPQAITGDTNSWVFLIGRNEDSGTRVTAQAESQLTGQNPGEQSFGRAMKQYYLTFETTTASSIATDGTWAPQDTYTGTNTNPTYGYTGGTYMGNIQTGGTGTAVLDFGLWPAYSPLSTETSIDWDIKGHSGQIGGGDVAKVLSASNPVTGLAGTSISSASIPGNWGASSKAYFIGYIGIADATSIPFPGGANSAEVLTYNGVTYSPAAILNGMYDYWGYEHMYYPGAAVGSAYATFADALADEVFSQDCQTQASGSLAGQTDLGAPNAYDVGILLNSSALFQRTAEGYPIVPINN